MVDFNRLLQNRLNAKLLREKRAMATRKNTDTYEEYLNSTEGESSAMPAVNGAPNADKNDKEENEFDMPEEFVADSTVTVPHTPSARSNQGSLSDDEFGEMGFNEEQDELERAKLNPPTGDWKKEDSWEYEKQVITEDSMPGDFDPNGRTFLIFKGKPIAREANGLSYEPALRLRISPDKRYKQDKPTEIDTAHKLFLKSWDMYLEEHSEKPAKMAQLRSMLEHDRYIIRTMNGDNGAIVIDVKLRSYQGKSSR